MAEDTAETLRMFYEEHAAQARHHEEQRSTSTSIISGIAAGVLGLAGLGGLSRSDIPAGIVVVFLSLLGAALSMKHYERNRFHTTVMGEARSALSNPNGRSTAEIRRTAEASHSENFSKRKKTDRGSRKKTNRRTHSRWINVRLNLLWAAVPLSITVVGVLLIVLAAVGVDGE